MASSDKNFGYFSVPNTDQRGIIDAYIQSVDFNEASRYVDPTLEALTQFGTFPMTRIEPGGSYRFGDGSVSAPSIGFAGDPDTGFYKSAVSRIDVTVDGTRELTFNSSGLQIADMTQGSVLFAGASGQVSQNNSNLFWDNSNARLGIGCTDPWRSLEVRHASLPQLVLSTDDNNAVLFQGNGLALTLTSYSTQAAAEALDLSWTGAPVGFTKSIRSVNTDTTNTTSNAYFVAQVGGSGSGDAASFYSVAFGTTWGVGLDNSDSDSFKISKNATLGTNDYLTVYTTGDVAFGTGNFYWDNTNLIVKQQGTSNLNTANQWRISGDTSDRFHITVNGTMAWGQGNGTTTVTMFHVADTNAGATGGPYDHLKFLLPTNASAQQYQEFFSFFESDAAHPALRVTQTGDLWCQYGTTTHRFIISGPSTPATSGMHWYGRLTPDFTSGAVMELASIDGFNFIHNNAASSAQVTAIKIPNAKDYSEVSINGIARLTGSTRIGSSTSAGATSSDVGDISAGISGAGDLQWDASTATFTLAYTQGSVYSTFVIDSSGRIAITPSGTGNQVLHGEGSAGHPSIAWNSGGKITGLFCAATDADVSVSINGSRTHAFQNGNIQILSDSAILYMGASFDTRLQRDAANIFAMQNGTTAQEFRVYGTTTGSKYLSLKHNGTDAIIDASSGIIQIGSTATQVKLSAISIITDTSTGLKIGTGTTQKLGFWNATPVVQWNTTGTTTGFTAGAGTTVDSAATFTGNLGSTAYTIGDIVKALKTCGVMAQ